MIRDFHLADLLTLANGGSGTAALFLAMDHVREAGAGKLYAAGALVAAALVFDVMDGRGPKSSLDGRPHEQCDESNARAGLDLLGR